MVKTPDNNCEHRLGHEKAVPVIYAGGGKYSDKMCNFLLHDGDEMLAPLCKAPQSNSENCPIAKFYRGELKTKNEAHKELDSMHGEHFAN